MDTLEIKQKLHKFDEFLNLVNADIGLYERWIDCMSDIEKLLDKHDSNFNISLPCRVGDTIYVVDTDPLPCNPFEASPRIIEYILVCDDGSIAFKDDYYDGIICYLENLVTDKPYLYDYRCFLTEEAATKFIKELNRV